jgi:hypothetical protein
MNRQATPLVEWLLDQDPMPEVRSLSLDEQLIDPTAIPATCRLVQLSCHALEHLEACLPHPSFTFSEGEFTSSMRSNNILTATDIQPT